MVEEQERETGGRRTWRREGRREGYEEPASCAFFSPPSVMCFVFREGSSVLSGDLEDDGSALPDPSPSESSLGRRQPGGT